MGYGFHVSEQRFHLAAEHRKAALAAIKEESAKQRLSWTGPESIAGSRRFEEAISELGWSCAFDEDDNVIGLTFEREKIGHEERWLEAISPFVTAGSYIDAVGEDGDHWRWHFSGAHLQTLRGRVVFDSPRRMEREATC